MQQLPVSSPNGEIFIGGRRLKAYELKGEQWLAVEIRDVDDFEQMRSSWAENRARKEIDPLEEGKHFKKMVDFQKLSGAQLARDLGLSDDYVLDGLQIAETYGLGGGEIIKGTGTKSELKKLTKKKAVALLSSWIKPEVRKKIEIKIKTEGMKEDQVQSLVLEIKKIQLSIEQEPDQTIKEKLEKEFGGDKVLEHKSTEVEDRRDEEHNKKPVQADENLPIDNFLEGQTVTVNTPQDVMARIVKYYLDRKGRYTGYKITVEGKIARSKKKKR
jgi:ParB-like chromosome segregation protein Spo0J